MELILIGLAFLVTSVILLLTIHFLIVGERHFSENCKEYDAVIMRYLREDNTLWDTPQVSLIGHDSSVMYRCKSKRMNSSTHPKGTKIRVAVYVKKLFGFDFYDIRVLDKDYAPYPIGGIVLALRILCFVLFATSLTFLVMGAT